MKKTISIFMIFLLSFSTIGPFPVFADTVYFPGAVSGSEVEKSSGLGTVTVTMNGGNDNWDITLQREYGEKDQQEAILDLSGIFKNVPAGMYHVRAEQTIDGTKIIKKSASIAVKPNTLSVIKTLEEMGEGNITSPSKDPYKLEVKKAIKTSKINLYIGDEKQPYRFANADGNGNATFPVAGTTIDARNTYRLTQVVNGVESERSDLVTVRPDNVTIEKKKDSGPNNNAGEILVKGTKAGNKIILYRSGGIIERTIDKTSTSEVTFDELPSGNYFVKHFENDVESEKVSNQVTILNEQLPVISLTKPNDNDLHYVLVNDKRQDLKYTEHGYQVIYKGKVYKGTEESKEFCDYIKADEDDEDDKGNCIIVTIDYKPTMTEIPAPGSGPLPGKYSVIYTATDIKKPNITSTITRNVTIYPNQLKLKSRDTEEAYGSLDIVERIAGKIEVKGTLAVPDKDMVTTLTLYQDQTGTNIEKPLLIDTITNANNNDFTFYNVPVGAGYFVVQEINSVKSAPSERVEIKDTTPPELKLNGAKNIKLEVGDLYTEYGAIAIDNIDTTEELAGRIQTKVYIPNPDVSADDIQVEAVDTSIPNVYTIKYSVKDKAGNEATNVIRTVNVLPGPVTAIGSIATIGEIGVKNIFPGIIKRETILMLYKFDKATNKFNAVTSVTIDDSRLTDVFKGQGPGRYYVTQTVNGQESRESNIVEIVDVDRPYITLNGPDKIKLVWDVDRESYYKEAGQKFTDPGAIANDYLQEKKLKLTAKMFKPDGKMLDSHSISEHQHDLEKESIIAIKPDTELTEPGTYKITYTATAPRGSEAVPKDRIIVLAPPKTAKPTSVAGKSEINVNSLFNHVTSVAKLYNTYNQLIDSIEVKSGTTATFEKVPAGLGYYVTQTVNGIESAPSTPVSIRIHAEADKSALLMTSFGFTSLGATGIIDQASGNITVTIPKGADLKKLTASFNIKRPDNTTASVRVNNILQTSGTTILDFTKPVKYTVSATIPGKSVTKDYTVTVVQANNSSTIWKDAINKNISITTGTQSITLTPSEKAAAAEKGISFMTSDAAIHVSAINVRESRNATLSVKKPNGVITTNDPAWGKKTTAITEIGWGGETRSFLQPIEVEIPNPSNKVFAKLIRGGDGKLFAVVQPSESVVQPSRAVAQAGIATETNIIGLATEPGIYALMDDIGRPVILPRVQNGKTVYTIASGNKDATIYYTTKSSNVRFNRSDRDRTLSGYMFDGSPTDLTNWTKYTGGNISTPTGELYAVVVHNQVISPIRAIDPEPATQWQDKDIPTVERHKIWNVTFNAKVDQKELYANAIYVTDDTTKRVVETTLRLSSDGKTIAVIPKTMYDSNKQYTLWIDKEMKGNTVNKGFLKEPTKLTFIAK